MLRYAGYLLICLALGKLWLEDRTYRAGVGGYVAVREKDRAIKACASAASAKKQLAAYIQFESAEDVSVVIGNPQLKVSLWDLGNAAWSDRYSRPYLLVVARSKPYEVSCAFDLETSAATLSQLG